MGYNVVATKRFESNYVKVYDMYCALGFRSSAAELELRIAELSGTLSAFPALFPKYNETHYGSKITKRYVAIEKYVVFYSVNEKKKQIELYDIVYSKKLK